MRNTFIVAHRWVALITGALLLATATSGAALVFEGAIERGLHPSRWRVVPPDAPTGAATAVPLALDTIVARVEARMPGATVMAITPSTIPDRAWSMGLGALNATVNPYTAEVLSTGTPEEGRRSLARRLHVFHVEFFAGSVGRTIVAGLSIVALFLVLTGIVLWWPDKLVRISTSASWKRITFDLHHVLGIGAAIILVVITASGVWIHSDVLARFIKRLDTTVAKPLPAQPPGPANAPRLSFDAVASIGRAALPGAEIVFIAMGNPKSPVSVAMRFPEDRTPGGRSRVLVNRFNGELLGTVSTRDAALGTRLDNLKRSLHTGDVLGMPTEALWFAAMLVMLSQIVTGALMWWNARKGRRRVSAGRATEILRAIPRGSRRPSG